MNRKFHWASNAAILPLMTREQATAILVRESGRVEPTPYNGVVYHYTSLAALSGILTSSSFFCTDYRHLNDRVELDYGLKLLRALIVANSERIGFDCETADNISRCIASLSLARSHMTMFCGSWSLRRNDLTQWRAYAPTDGVAVGFRVQELGRVLEEQGFVVQPVRYPGAAHFDKWCDQQMCELREGLEALNKSADDCREKAHDDPPGFREAYIAHQMLALFETWVGRVCGLIKNPDFISENEWRCVYVLRENTQQKRHPVQFRQSGSRTVPYVAADLSSADRTKLIAEVVIGPSAKPIANLDLVNQIACHSGWMIESIEAPEHSFRQP